MVLVVGATGQMGTEICRQLAEAALPIRALVRPGTAPERLEPLRALGAEIVVGERRDPHVLDAACRGATAVIAAASAALSRQAADNVQSFDREAQFELVRTARRAGVQRFVYIAIPGNFVIAAPVSWAQEEVEAELRASGITYTILRPSYLMESWLSPAVGFDPAHGTARIFGTGRQKISWISRADVAAFAVDSITNPAARNAVISLGGPEALSPMEVVHTFEIVTGRQIMVQHVLDDAIRRLRESTRDPVAQSLATLMLGYAQGDVVDMRRTSAAFHVRLHSVRDYAQRVARDAPPPPQWA